MTFGIFWKVGVLLEDFDGYKKVRHEMLGFLTCLALRISIDQMTIE